MQLRDTIAQVVAKLKYKTDIMNPKRITRTANCIHLHCTIKVRFSQQGSPVRVLRGLRWLMQFCCCASQGPAPLRRRLLQLEAEIAKPTPEVGW